MTFGLGNQEVISDPNELFGLTGEEEGLTGEGFRETIVKEEMYTWNTDQFFIGDCFVKYNREMRWDLK